MTDRKRHSPLPPDPPGVEDIMRPWGEPQRASAQEAVRAGSAWRAGDGTTAASGGAAPARGDAMSPGGTLSPGGPMADASDET
jgi:hypothetical protein